ASYETTTKASIPEDLIKAESDARAAHEALDAQQKLFDSRLSLFKAGALPRKDLDQSEVALTQAKAQSQVADQHLAAMEAVGKQQTAKSAAGQLQSATGKLEGAKAQLGYTEIRSPIDGVVTDRPLWLGETPPAGTALLTVMDASSVTARAHIPPSDAALLKVGDSAVIHSTGGDFPGKVSVISPALDPGGTTIEIWVEAANKKGTLRPGSIVQMEINAVELNDAITIPLAALLKTPEGATTVMVVGSDDKAHQTEVETGIQNNERVQITKGLSPGQTVITTGAYGLPDNTKVKAASSGGQSTPDSQKTPAEKD
ncbi:MAG: efflux RND transporter periplasmic adaptor subunit, partial [Limisphaerales bacterium]